MIAGIWVAFFHSRQAMVVRTGLFAAPHQTSGPLMLGPTVSKMKRDEIDEETMGR